MLQAAKGPIYASKLKNSPLRSINSDLGTD